MTELGVTPYLFQAVQNTKDEKIRGNVYLTRGLSRIMQ